MALVKTPHRYLAILKITCCEDTPKPSTSARVCVHKKGFIAVNLNASLYFI